MIAINYRDTRPIYEQLKDAIRTRIVQNIIEPDEKLPSVREMATSLSINPNTIQRAYKDLETEGYVYSVVGKGTFASPADATKSPRLTELLQQITPIIKELLYLGMSADEILQFIQIQLKGGTSID